jgi:tetratricopeptide (TPR) repeat protein
MPFRMGHPNYGGVRPAKYMSVLRAPDHLNVFRGERKKLALHFVGVTRIPMGLHQAPGRTLRCSRIVAQGHISEAIDRARTTLEAEPPIVNVVYGTTLIYARRSEEAADMFLNAIELDPVFPLARWALALGYQQQGMYTEAIAELEIGQRLPGAMPIITGLLGCACACNGQVERAERLRIDLGNQAKRKHVAPLDSALIHLGLGNVIRPLNLSQASAKIARFGLFTSSVLSMFGTLRSDPRYQKILRRIKL